jgi:hypothetical protein
MYDAKINIKLKSCKKITGFKFYIFTLSDEGNEALSWHSKLPEW